MEVVRTRSKTKLKSISFFFKFQKLQPMVISFKNKLELVWKVLLKS